VEGASGGFPGRDAEAGGFEPADVVADLALACATSHRETYG